MKRRAIQLYAEGLGLRAIGRFLGASRVSVMRRVREYAREAEEIRLSEPPESSGDIALDEMWRYVSKKKRKLWIWIAFDRQKGIPQVTIPIINLYN